MKTITHAVAALAVIGCAAGAGVVASSGDAPTAQTLVERGWTCTFPEGRFHCRPPGQLGPLDGPATVDFRVFDATGAEFLGTEHLIRADLYAGEPCPQSPTGEYQFVPRGPGYYACHHFAS
jgi:hypothetical protein